MSTKAIRKALRLFGETNVTDDPSGEKSHALHDALAEMDAIERAAKAWWEAESKRGRGMVAHEAAATLERIAKEAP